MPRPKKRQRSARNVASKRAQPVQHEDSTDTDEDVQTCHEEKAPGIRMVSLLAEGQENKSHLRAAQSGHSRATHYRQKANVESFKRAAHGSLPLSTYFQPRLEDGENDMADNINIEGLELEADVDFLDDVIDINIEEEEVDEEEEYEDGGISEFNSRVISEINNHFINNFSDISQEECSKLLGVLQYLYLRQQGLNKGAASQKVANTMSQSQYWGRCLVNWSKQWDKLGKITLSNRGKNTHVRKSILSSQAVYDQVFEWLQDHPFDVTPTSLQEFVNTSIIPEINSAQRRPISTKTATRWLTVMGWVRSKMKPGMYVDGHEREDVVAYRKIFLERMQDFDPLLIKTLDGSITDIEVPQLGDKKPIVFYTHDECIFFANDGERVKWHPKGRMPFYKKTNGRALMVSEFISELSGTLQHTYPDGTFVQARRIITPGKAADGYWTGENVAQQFREAIKIHKDRYPEYDGLWAFDNSTNHRLFAPDALRISKMNLGPGGKQALPRHGYFDGHEHPMVYPADYEVIELRGQAKGMRQVLLERNLWPPANPVKVCNQCQGCKLVDKPRDRTNCCAERILELQPDFQAQEGLLAEIARMEGQQLIFYPKFHCEFNFIEMFWGAAKRTTRKNCDYSFAGLKATVPEALDGVDLCVIRRFARKTFRYMDAYRKGLSGQEAERQVRQFRSHRRILEKAVWDEELAVE